MKKSGDKHYFETQGYSMWPFVRHQDKIIVEEVSCADLRPGDIVVFTSGGKHVCHRLVRKKMKEDKFLLFTRGDYCTSWKTEAVVQEQVTGRVTALVRDSRIIPLSGIMHAVTGMLIIVFFPPAAWMVSCAEKIMKKR